ncbi:MAG: glycosyltransferase [Micrococcus sp.]|nr:glycosyltransferase [Micrococcus sp.]
MPHDSSAPRRPRMAMLVGNRVVGDSRVEKSAVSAVRAGYDVTIVGISHREEFNLGRYGTIPIWRIPLRLDRHAAWRRLHEVEDLAQAPWGSVLDAEPALEQLGWDQAHASGAGLAQAVARGVSPHRLTDALRGRLSAVARGVDTRVARLARAQSVSLPNAAGARGRRAVKNFASGRPGGWREVWPLIADYEAAFLGALIDLDPDIIHVHDRHPMPAAVAYGRYRKAQGLARVPWVYDAHEWLPGQMMPGPVDQRIAWKAAEAELIHDADAVLAVTDELAQRMRAYHRLNEVPSTVYNGPWAEHVALDPADRRDLRTELGLDADIPVMVYVGRLAAVRGIMTMVEALPHLPEVHVAFVGSPDPAPREALRERAEELGVGARVHITDYVPSASVTWYISTATLGASPLLPTPAHESAVPTKLREYLLAGLPLVVSDLREQARFVQGQSLGAVHAPDDAEDLARAVRSVLDQLPDYRRRLADPAVIDRHRWEGSERALHEVWHSLAPRTATPLEADIAPDHHRDRRGDGLLMVGNDADARALADAWPSAAGDVRRREGYAVPEQRRGLVQGNADEAWNMLRAWVDEDRHCETVLSTAQERLYGRAEASLEHEMHSLMARGHRTAVYAGHRHLGTMDQRLLAVPNHPWAELDEGERGRIDRQIRRQARAATQAAHAGVPVFTHRWLESLLVPHTVWLPPLAPTHPGDEAQRRDEVTTALLVPGDRTRREAEELAAVRTLLERSGITLIEPSARAYRQRPSSFTADVVLTPLQTGDLHPAVVPAMSHGSLVVTGPLTPSARVASPELPVLTVRVDELTAAVETLLASGSDALAEQSEAAVQHARDAHSGPALARRIWEVTEGYLAASE